MEVKVRRSARWSVRAGSLQLTRCMHSRVGRQGRPAFGVALNEEDITRRSHTCGVDTDTLTIVDTLPDTTRTTDYELPRALQKLLNR